MLCPQCLFSLPLQGQLAAGVRYNPLGLLPSQSLVVNGSSQAIQKALKWMELDGAHLREAVTAVRVRVRLGWTMLEEAWE